MTIKQLRRIATLIAITICSAHAAAYAEGTTAVNAGSHSVDSAAVALTAHGSLEIKGGVSKTDVAPDQLLDELTIAATDKDNRAAALKAKEAKYTGTFRKTVAKASDMIQFATAYKGFQSSSEAADVILEEKLKLKSRAAVDWLKQKQHDELHAKVASSLMQLASGLGCEDQAKQAKIVQSGMTQLTQLVGKEKAQAALSSLTAWAASVKDSGAVAPSEPFDVLTLEANTNKLVENSLKQDSVILETKKRLHGYNHRSKFMQATAKIVNTSLSVAMFSPTVISPVAQLALMSFLMSTGGPEEAKLLKELYLDRRIECRYKMINQEISLAMNNYNVASMTGNAVLGQFCKTAASKMAGKQLVAQLLPFEEPEIERQCAGDPGPARNSKTANSVKGQTDLSVKAPVDGTY